MLEFEQSGQLTPGQFADLAILDADPVAGADLRAISVTATLVEGEVVYGSL